AHLLLARASRRSGEFSIRRALGASSGDIVSQLLTEGVLLAAVSSGLGLVTAYWAKSVAVALVPAAIRPRLDFRMDGRVLLFAMGLSAFTTLIFALGPACRAAREVGRYSEGRFSRSPRVVHHMLVVAQIGLAVVSLVTAGLFLRSLRAAG